jgi:hypothetical protein
MHPHGVFLSEGLRGHSYLDGSSGADRMDDSVPPGRTHVYSWPVPERAGPATATAARRSGCTTRTSTEGKDINSGLIGPMIVTRRGMARDGRLVEGDRPRVRRRLRLFERDRQLVPRRERRDCTAIAKKFKRNEAKVREFHSSSRSTASRGERAVLTMRQVERVRWYLFTNRTSHGVGHPQPALARPDAGVQPHAHRHDHADADDDRECRTCPGQSRVWLFISLPHERGTSREGCTRASPCNPVGGDEPQRGTAGIKKKPARPFRANNELALHVCEPRPRGVSTSVALGCRIANRPRDGSSRERAAAVVTSCAIRSERTIASSPFVSTSKEPRGSRAASQARYATLGADRPHKQPGGVLLRDPSGVVFD